ncbi:MAG: hypothetical protein AB7Q37_14890 [Pyrinomonadaceae bacterium]
MKIALTQAEFDYLLMKSALPTRSNTINRELSNDRQIALEVTEDEAVDMRELVSEFLQLEGFDAEYKLTKKGKICESLIDKLFVP